MRRTELKPSATNPHRSFAQGLGGLGASAETARRDRPTKPTDKLSYFITGFQQKKCFRSCEDRSRKSDAPGDRMGSPEGVEFAAFGLSAAPPRRPARRPGAGDLAAQPARRPTAARRLRPDRSRGRSNGPPAIDFRRRLKLEEAAKAENPAGLASRASAAPESLRKGSAS